MNDTILEAVKWADLVAQIEPGTPSNFPLKHKATIRSEISGRILKEFPEREYRTWVDKKANTITVYRVK